MRLRITGAGHIGGNIARRAALAGYNVMVSFARDQAQLAALADEIDGVAGDPADAATADLVVLSAPWDAIDEALAGWWGGWGSNPRPADYEKYGLAAGPSFTR